MASFRAAVKEGCEGIESGELDDGFILSSQDWLDKGMGMETPSTGGDVIEFG